MPKALAVAWTTLPGAIAAGMVATAVVTSALTFVLWGFTGRNSNAESKAMGVAAGAALAIALLITAALWTWGRYLQSLLSHGARLAAEVCAVQFRRHNVVIVRLADGVERRINVVGRVNLRPGDFVTLRVRSAHSWPVLIENIFRAA